MSLRRLTDDGRLIDVVPLERERFDTGKELVPVERACPECGGGLALAVQWQDALVRHGGYGGTRRVDTEWCFCGYERVSAVATERPPR